MLNCYPYHEDLTRTLAKRIVAENQQHLPTLDHIVILMPNYHASTRLREQITYEASKLNCRALLGPQIYTLKDYVEKNTLLEKRRIPSSSRELILVQALEENQGLFGQQNSLTLAYALLELFDELTRNQLKLPEDIDDFIEQLQIAYDCTERQLAALSQEAQIVHKLWYAWHAQLEAMDALDLESHYQIKLSQNLKQISNHFYYIAGYYELLPSEVLWLNKRLVDKQACLLFHGESGNYGLHPANVLYNLFQKLPEPIKVSEPTTDASFFLDAVFNNQTEHLQVRAKNLSSQMPNSPISNLNNARSDSNGNNQSTSQASKNIHIFSGNGFEDEAIAIEQQIRTWMAENKKRIALIIEDRALARRVRALLERSGIGLKDMEGWALSTSYAASIIESWLQNIEENFHYIPLLDILKSPLCLSDDLNNNMEAVYRFEQDIIQHENVVNDINRYKKALHFRQNRLNKYNPNHSKNILKLLDHIDASALPLRQLFEIDNSPISVYLLALETSLDKLGASEKLQQDGAGQCILTLIEKLKDSISDCDITLDWMGFRHWFGKKMEEATFIPESNNKYFVELLHLSQSSLGNYEALIIGSMTRETYPGNIKQTPFFNQTVKMEIGLPSAASQQQVRFYHFRRLLESSPNILLSYHKGEEEKIPSPWLTLIQQFHQLAFGNTLQNATLMQQVKFQKNLGEPKNKHLESSENDIAVIRPEQLPESLSASAHQTLINCPYVFFTTQALKLQAPEEIKETLAKSDYGERVHLCLQAFHAGDIDYLPGPFTQPINIETRKIAIDFLNDINEQVFKHDLEDNFQHRGWFKRWANAIPKYIDWQIQREAHWQFKAGENQFNTQLHQSTQLHGRVDRIDVSQLHKQQTAIIDYKTGAIPKQLDIDNGEAVQLVHYSLANESLVNRVEYLQIETSSKQVASKCIVEDEELRSLENQTEIRLKSIYQLISQGEKLPAWGVEKICEYCRFDGLCRKEFKA